MTAAEFSIFCNEVFETIRALIPYDTKNMQQNAFTMIQVAPNEYHFYIDEKIAPYVFYTNEPWLAPKWNEKKNPNEHWWNDAILAIIQNDLARKGKIKYD